VTFETIDRFVLPRRLVEEAEEALQAAGREGAERFVLWSGVTDGPTFRVLTQHVPRQTAYRFESGLCVRVDGSELHRLNTWLYENGEQLAIQVHTHPTDAYHSDTDDAFAMVTTHGGLSIVVPWFGADGMFVAGTAADRLTSAGWRLIDPVEIGALIEVSD
jgi:hypothetical protein